MWMNFGVPVNSDVAVVGNNMTCTLHEMMYMGRNAFCAERVGDAAAMHQDLVDEVNELNDKMRHQSEELLDKLHEINGTFMDHFKASQRLEETERNPLLGRSVDKQSA